jgi:hypothetical protein
VLTFITVVGAAPRRRSLLLSTDCADAGPSAQNCGVRASYCVSRPFCTRRTPTARMRFNRAVGKSHTAPGCRAGWASDVDPSSVTTAPSRFPRHLDSREAEGTLRNEIHADKIGHLGRRPAELFSMCPEVLSKQMRCEPSGWYATCCFSPYLWTSRICTTVPLHWLMRSTAWRLERARSVPEDENRSPVGGIVRTGTFVRARGGRDRRTGGCGGIQ